MSEELPTSTPHGGTHQQLPIDLVKLDVTNPRIKRFLEMYEGTPNDEQIGLALGEGDDSSASSGTTFSKLKQSIQTNGGIIQPIIVNQFSDSGELVCIEGNTRLFIYRSFRNDGIDGDWNEIPAIVYSDLDEVDMDAIRLQAHLVGPRAWDPYSKAKYLTYLRNHEHIPFSELVDYCGGSQNEVQSTLDAYHDMETYYRPLLDADQDFDPTRFSGFVEYQRKNVKAAVIKNGFSGTDFAKWIHTQKVHPLNAVRKLPQVLNNKDAREIFLKSGIGEAVKSLELPSADAKLKEISLVQLAKHVEQRVTSLPYSKVEQMKKEDDSPEAQALADLFNALKVLPDELLGEEI